MEDSVSLTPEEASAVLAYIQGDHFDPTFISSVVGKLEPIVRALRDLEDVEAEAD